MNSFIIRQLSINDGQDIYDMLQRIGKNENEFKNTANGLSYEQFKEWLIEQDDWSKGEHLPQGYVPQTVFWLFARDTPVGFGKIRHALNEHSQKIGGNIGYAIDPGYRGNGYSNILLKGLLKKAKEMGVAEILLTVEKNNVISKKVIENNGGSMIKENNYRWYYKFY